MTKLVMNNKINGAVHYKRWLQIIIVLVLVIYSHRTKTATLDLFHIQTMGEGKYMTVNASIHENHKQFDLYVNVHRELERHDLFANMKFKTKPFNATEYRVIFSWKRIDLCKFLANIRNDTMFQLFFRNRMFSIVGLTCPIRKRLYYFKNIGIAEQISPGSLQNGNYRFFCEIAQLSGDFVKIFAIQIHAVYQ